MNLVLCAYHSSGCRVLEHVAARRDVDRLAVFTHDPGPAVPDVAAAARRLGVWVSTDDVSTATLPFAPQIVASVYYRNIIRAELIAACGGRIFNAHPSLLPRHRGASSIPWAIIEGDELTGITYHYIDEGIDTGPVILQAVIPIAPDETQETLYAKAMDRVVDFWPAAFELVKAGFRGVPQQGPSCYHGRGAPYGGEIDETWPDEFVERFIRAMVYPPYPAARFRGIEVRSMEQYDRLRVRDA